jgi:hypothetical protein
MEWGESGINNPINKISDIGKLIVWIKKRVYILIIELYITIDLCRF